MNQVVGNWPGKTIGKAEGYTEFQGYKFNIIDLPGIYSLSTYSLEEIVTREYIINEKPDYIINVVNSNHLERNLYFSLQLFMLKRPIIISLNQYDILQKQGFDIDVEKLEDELQVPVQKTVAVHNRGVHELLERIIEIEENDTKIHPREMEFGREIEKKIEKMIARVKEEDLQFNYPLRFLAQKLLEGDENAIALLKQELKKNEVHEKDFIDLIQKERRELEDLHGHYVSELFNGEFYNQTSKIVNSTLKIEKQTRKNKVQNFFDHITVHSIWGYVLLGLILMGSYLFVFWLGDLISSALDGLYGSWTEAVLQTWTEDSWEYRLFWKSMMGGLIAGVGGVLPFVIPFYIIIEILQDVGYLPRAAYLMDKLMQSVGLHGKAIIPILLGFGCNVPAISATMIMETESEKKRAVVITSLIPCSAVTVIVMGLVAKYLGIWYALLLYGINFLIILIVGKLMQKVDPEEDTDLIIEFHDFRKPNTKVILKQTWQRSKEFVYMALPLIILFGVILEVLMEFSLLEPINLLMKPITVYYLGLPVGVSVYLFYGILRKELNLVLLQLYVSSLGLTMTQYMTPIQMITFTLMTMLYAPCLATIMVIKRHEGTKFATKVFFYLLGIALVISGIVRWGYELIVFLLSL